MPCVTDLKPSLATMATDNKYDRQLRLWGANGQKKLSESTIVLVNATAAGTETLKNLVLPGIGHFHIIDDVQIPSTSCSCDSISNTGDGDGNGKDKCKCKCEPFSNFFVFDSSHEGSKGRDDTSRSRASIATQHLAELNPDVKGSYSDVDSLESADYSSILSSLISNASNRDSNLLVIAADLPPKILHIISSLCWNGISIIDGNGNGNSSISIPFIIAKSYGLIGSVRLQTPHHSIIESKPDNAKPDLRLAATSIDPDLFPELQQLANSIDMESLDGQQHCHVPYVILLLKAMDKWRIQIQVKGHHDHAEIDGNAKRLPITFQEKKEFQTVLESLARNMDQELNFVEANQNYYLAYTHLEFPDEGQELIDSAEARIVSRGEVSIRANSSSVNKHAKVKVDTFDVLLLALKKFMVTHQGFPPLNGSIPDMTASTLGYIELQGIYKNKAEKDKLELSIIIDAIGREYGNDVIPTVSEDELSIFCKNVYNIRLIETRSYEQEYQFDFGDEKDEILGEVAMATFDPYEVPDHTPLLWYIALRACDMFYDEHGHYPGQDNRELALESDANNVQKFIVHIVDKLGLSDNELVQSTLLSQDEDKKNAFGKEMTRYNNAEVHNIASIVGGVASQEAVKMITGQYIPMDGNYIFNGIAGVAGICKL